MPTKVITTPELVSIASELFRTQGYHNTSISDVAHHCGLSKASVYHHMSSKKALVLACIRQAQQYFENNFNKVAYDEKLSKTKRLKQVTAKLEKLLLSQTGGTLVGNLALEVKDQDAEINKLIQAYFANWKQIIAHLLTEKYDKEKASALAEDIIAMTQGAIMMLAIYHDDSQLKRVNQKLLALLS